MVCPEPASKPLPEHNIAPVSVVIPCYRCAQTIGRAVESVISQTTAPCEVILVDDASDDETLDMLYAIANSPMQRFQIKVISLQQNVGVASARNIGWAAASGEYIAFLDADDTWHPQKLAIQYLALSRDRSVYGCGTQHTVTESVLCGYLTKRFEIAEILFNDLLWRNRFVTSSIMLKNDGRFRFTDGLRHMEDHLLWMEITGVGNRLICIQVILTAHHKADFGAGGLSGDLFSMELADIKNFYNIYRRQLIGALMFSILIILSIAKYIRRLVIVYARRVIELIGLKKWLG